MADFIPIETKEDFEARTNTIIQERLSRQQKQFEEKYAGFEELKKANESWQTEKQAYEKTIADNKAAYDALTEQLTTAQGKIKEFETDALKTQIAIENKLPLELRSYLKGSTAEEIKASAEELSGFTKASKAPLAYPEPEPTAKDAEEKAYKTMLKELKGD